MTPNLKSLDRRTFLRGCGVTMALPLMESLRTRQVAANEAHYSPTRVAFFYIPNGVVQSAWHPQTSGSTLEFSPTLKPLEPLREKLTLLTNLDRVKVPGTDGHAQASTCWLSSAAPDELSPAGYPLKRTVDQIIAEEAGKYTAFRSLELSCNPYEDNKESVYFDNISWYGHGHVARSLRDPAKVFRRLFAVREHAANRSVLDIVLEDARSLNRKLGRLDRDKLGEYMESVRTVEQQIERITQRQAEIDKLNLTPPTKPWQAMARDEFIQVMGDLMVLALRTDLTRVCTLMTGPERWSSPLQVDGLFEKPIQHHGWTHNQHDENVRKKLEQLDRFHVEQFARLATKMDAIQEGEGTLLDQTVFLLGSGISDGSLHVYTDLPTVIVGSGGGRLATNRHARHAKGTPLANLWLTLAQMMGVPTNRLGDSTGPLSDLLA